MIAPNNTLFLKFVCADPGAHFLLAGFLTRYGWGTKYCIILQVARVPRLIRQIVFWKVFSCLLDFNQISRAWEGFEDMRLIQLCNSIQISLILALPVAQTSQITFQQSCLNIFVSASKLPRRGEQSLICWYLLYICIVFHLFFKKTRKQCENHRKS